MVSVGHEGETRTETLLRGIQSSGLCVIYYDADLALRLIENSPHSWPDTAALMAGGDGAIFDPFTAERVLAAKREVLSTGARQLIEAPQRREGADLLWFELSFERDVGADDVPRGVFVVVSDVTQTKRREAALRDLVYEVSHRSRNLLAVLQSILGQTAATAATVGEFEEKFRGRIASLAQSQDLITYANWQSVRFRRLAETQIAPFSDVTGVAPVIDGLDPLLSPNTTLHVGLALHELAANSQHYGVLGNGAGTIRVTIVSTDGQARLEWTEVPAKPTIPAVEAWGFGRTVLENVVPRALDASAAYSVEADLVHYVIDLPEAEPEAAAEDAPADWRQRGHPLR